MPAATPKVVRKPLNELQPAPYNPRTVLAHTDPRYRKLKRSLQSFGLVEPLVWNRRTGYLVGGHQRLQVLKDLGHTDAPVSVVDLAPEQEKALNVMLNNRAAQSDWDLPLLRDVLEELARGANEDLRDSGFEPGQLDLLRRQLSPMRTSSPPPPEPTLCEVAILVPAARYEEFRPRLDRLLTQTGLECHVRWR